MPSNPSSSSPPSLSSLLPIRQFGAQPNTDGQTKFCVWAPKAKRLTVQRVNRSRRAEQVISEQILERDQQGLFSGVMNDCPAGSLYRFCLDNQPGRPDPYSRFQPFGVHGPSEVIASDRFHWSDQNWRGVEKRDLVVYELHVGSFTEAGTYQSAIAELDRIKELGATAIELLPIAQTPGRWNWGYDGVNFFAPRNTFGRPDDLKAFVDACHARQLAVILDVVYNHVGPEGNYLNEFGPYRSKKHTTPWGDSLNFDGPGNERVREFVIRNVLFWINEYHFDGLRLDAIHYMFDESELSIIEEIQQRFREHQKTIDRTTYLIAESNIYDHRLVEDAAESRPHYDAIWSDCLMHSLYSLGDPELRLTDRHYTGTPDVAAALEHAYVFSFPGAFRVDQSDRKKHHPSGDRRYLESLVMALQTHDSVGNHPHGKRLHQLMGVDFQKAAAPLILLYPSIPMIFMGEESASESPFPFFADFEDPALRKAVDQGRRAEYPHHQWAGSPLPSDRQAFYDSKLDPAKSNSEILVWYQQLLALRKQGIAEGWLNFQFMKTECDFDGNLFRLTYQSPSHQVFIDSRLAPTDSESLPQSVESPRTLLLDSKLNSNPAQSNQKSEFHFAPRHCKIWKFN